MKVLTMICFNETPAIVVNWDEITDGDITTLIESPILGLSADEIDAATHRDATDDERTRWQVGLDEQLKQDGGRPEDFPFFCFDLRPFAQ